MRDMFLDTLVPVKTGGPPVKPPTAKPVKLGGNGDGQPRPPVRPNGAGQAMLPPSLKTAPAAAPASAEVRATVDAMVAALLEAGDLYWDNEAGTYRARPCCYGLRNRRPS